MNFVVLVCGKSFISKFSLLLSLVLEINVSLLDMLFLEVIEHFMIL